MKSLIPALLLCSGLLSVNAAAAGDVAQGKVLYDAYCTQCHGLDGSGGGINVADMAVMPRDHTNTTDMKARSDEELVKVIKHGGASINKSVLMPAWEKNLTDPQIGDLVAYLRELCCN